MDDTRGNSRREDGDLEARRERAIDVLTTAFARNSISVEEYEASAGKIQNLRTSVEIDGILALLPRDQDTAIEPPVPQNPVHEEKIVCNGSSRRIANAMLLAPRLIVEIAHGVLKLDYSSLSIPRGIYDVSIKAIHSSFTLMIPEGVTIDNRVNLQYSSVSEPRSNADEKPRGAIIRLSGDLIHSTLKVRRPGGGFWGFLRRGPHSSKNTR